LSADAVFVVTREGSALMMRQGTTAPKSELLAETPTKFFIRGQDLTVTFVANPAGTIDKLVLDTGNQTLDAKRRK
jgi:hypothetical protein